MSKAKGGGARRVIAMLLWAMASIPACYMAPTSMARARHQPEARRDLGQRIDALVAAVDPNLHLGLVVASTRDGAVLIERNAAQRFVPASTLKLLTAAAALQLLGPQHRFRTDVAVDEADKSGRTVRHVYLKGSGDPQLTYGDVAELAASLRQQGVASITGDIVVDDSAFDAVPWGRGWMWDDLVEGFSAPVSATNVASNNLVLQVQHGARVGAPLRATTLPASNFVKVVNLATTASSGMTANLHVAVNNAPPDALGLQVGQTVTLTGTLSIDARPQYRRFAVRDPAVWVGTLFKEQLRAQRIDVTGYVRQGTVLAGASAIATHLSPPLSSLLIDAVKASDNHAMECILKRMGQLTGLTAGNWVNGTQAVRRFAQQYAGLDMDGLALEDGSGSSRYSLMAPAQMVRFLLFVRESFELGPELIAALPIGGTDGTLMHRMGHPALHNRVRAKTGTHTGVSNLAGFLKAEDGEVLAFAIMMDAYAGPISTLRTLQDNILLQLAAAPWLNRPQ